MTRLQYSSKDCSGILQTIGEVDEIADVAKARNPSFSKHLLRLLRTTDGFNVLGQAAADNHFALAEFSVAPHLENVFGCRNFPDVKFPSILPVLHSLDCLHHSLDYSLKLSVSYLAN